MQKLIERARFFPARVAAQADRFAALAGGQQPQALFISCSDSRVMPALFTGATPGEIFELRTAGNVVPRFRPHAGCAVAASLEYAVEVLAVADIVVCGHTYCGAVRALTEREPLEQMPSVARWLAGADFRAEQAPEAGPGSGDFAEQSRRHLTAQLNHLYTYPFIARRTSAGLLRIRGWFYAVDTGQITVRTPTGAFVDL